MKIILSGGGTLGSVTPLLALAQTLRKNQSVEFFWLGTKTGPERWLVEQEQIKFIPIPAGKWRRYFSFKNIFDLLKILVGFIKTLYLLYKLQPQVVVVAGGFVGVPVGWAAWLWGIPLIIHQQDVQIGLANRLLGWCATQITSSWPTVPYNFFPDKVKVIGTPLREIFYQPVNQERVLKSLGFTKKQPVLLVIGGGTGAEFFNQFIYNHLNNLRKVCQIIQITGLAKGINFKTDSGYQVADLVTDEIVEYLAVADLVLSRAGMGVIAELAHFAKPTIIVPLPATHQEQNAQYLQQHQAALMVPQSQLTETKLLNILGELKDYPESFIKLGTNLKALFPANASDKLAEIIRQVVKKI